MRSSSTRQARWHAKSTAPSSRRAWVSPGPSRCGRAESDRRSDELELFAKLEGRRRFELDALMSFRRVAVCAGARFRREVRAILAREAELVAFGFTCEDCA